MPNKKNILIIEDDAFLAKFYKARLKQKGYSATCIDDGNLANQKAQEEKPDVILLDILLPHKNGFDILEDLKNNPSTKNIPVIVSTLLTQEPDKKILMDLGSYRFFAKTETNIEDLLDEVIETASKGVGA